MGLGLYTRKFHSNWKMLCFIFKLFKTFFFSFSYPLKRSISKWKWHFEMKHSSSFQKCWYKAFWHFLKPFSFMCACVYEDYLKDETWPYKFIRVDKTIQVEVCIKMYFSIAKDTSPSCKKTRGIAAGFNQFLWATWSSTFAAGPKLLQSEITIAQPLQNPFSVLCKNIKLKKNRNKDLL